MMVVNTLETPRLLLRPFHASDIPDIVQLLQDPDIAKTTLNIPYPYSEEDARAWLDIQEKERKTGTGYTFAILRKEDQRLIGAIDIRPDLHNWRAEIGYWIGKPFWGRGYATEAAQAIIRFGFEELSLNRIYATHFADNPASGRVMQKVGMVYEGTMRQYTFKNHRFQDHALYAILREDWERSNL